MGYILTQDGPIWEHIAGQWYQGGNGGDSKFMLCENCAESWSSDNADFSFEGYAEGYQQTGGFLEAVEVLDGDQCIQCGRKHSATASDTAASLGRARLPILLALLALIATTQACVHGASFSQAMHQQHCRLTSADTRNETAYLYNAFSGRATPYMRVVTTECYQCGAVTQCGPR